jgi:hypothetical protein
VIRNFNYLITLYTLVYSFPDFLTVFGKFHIEKLFFLTYTCGAELPVLTRNLRKSGYSAPQVFDRF